MNRRGGSPASKRSVIALVAIATVAFLLRSIWLLRSGAEWTVATDSVLYLSLARGIRMGCGFATWRTSCGAPEVMRTPGYPLFLVPFIEHYRLAILIQALMGTMVCLIAGRFTAKRYGWNAALAAAAIVAIDIPTILSSKQLLTEALFQLICTSAILVSTVGYAILGGLGLGMAALVRPIALILIPVCALPYLLARQWRSAGTAAIAALIVIGAWSYRNYRQTGLFTLTVEGSMNLYSCTLPAVLSTHDGVSLEQEQRRVAAELAQIAFGDRHELLATALQLPPTDAIVYAVESAPSISRFMLARSVSIIARHPIDTTIVTIKGLLTLMFVPHAPEVGLSHLVSDSNASELIRLSSMTFEATVLAIMWIGVARAFWRWPQDHNLWILMGAATLLLLAAAPNADFIDVRYRSPAIPFLAILAGAGWFGCSSETKRNEA